MGVNWIKPPKVNKINNVTLYRVLKNLILDCEITFHKKQLAIKKKEFEIAAKFRGKEKELLTKIAEIVNELNS